MGGRERGESPFKKRKAGTMKRKLVVFLSFLIVFVTVPAPKTSHADEVKGNEEFYTEQIVLLGGEFGYAAACNINIDADEEKIKRWIELTFESEKDKYLSYFTYAKTYGFKIQLLGETGLSCEDVASRYASLKISKKTD